MTGKDLFREIGLISEEYIIEAEEVKRSIIVNPMFRKGLVTAACLCVCCVLYLGIRQLAGGGSDTASNSSENVQWAEVAMDEASAPEMPIEYSTNDGSTGTISQGGATEEKNEAVTECLEIAEESSLDSDSVTEAEGTVFDEVKQTESAAKGDNQMQETISDQMENIDKMREVEEICDRFAAYSDSSEELAKEGLVVNLHGSIKAGQERLSEFLSDIEGGKEASIEVVQFTIEGDPMFYYLHYNGADFYVVIDYRRDAFAGSGDKVHEYRFKEFKVFEEVLDGGTKIYEIVLTDEGNLSLEELQSGEYEYLYIMQYSE